MLEHMAQRITMRSKRATVSNRAARKTQRMTTTLSDSDLLRGTAPATLFECAGRHLRSSASDETTFARSFKVDGLDYFLSHSWHAPWQHKCFTLLLYFNGFASVWGCWLASYIGGVLMKRVSYLAHYSEYFLPFAEILKLRLLAMLIGFGAMYLTLASWSRCVTFCPTRSRTIFLDKVCIHQDDPVMKKQGIQSIGAILASSNCFLIVWDTSYFSRLWCVYEIAAFLHTNPEGYLVLLPVKLGFFAMVLCLVSAAATLFHTLSAELHLAIDSDQYQVFLSMWLKFGVWCVFSLILSVMCRHYAIELDELHHQISNFSVRASQCFCCSCDHVHPVSGATVACDREVVYASIRHWNDSQHVDGLEKFDSLVQRLGERGGAVHTMVRSVVPYPFMCLICCPVAFVQLSVLGKIDFGDWIFQLYCFLQLMEIALLRLPLLMVSCLWTHYTFHSRFARLIPVYKWCAVVALSSLYPFVMSIGLDYVPSGIDVIAPIFCLEGMSHPEWCENPQTALVRGLVLCLELFLIWLAFCRARRQSSSPGEDTIEMESLHCTASAVESW